MQETQKGGGFSISTISIRRHIGTLMLALAVLVMGVFFMIKIPVDLLPSITYPRIGVRIDAPGLSPEVAIDEVTRPLESAFSATEGVLQIFSQTREGRISLDLYFQPGGNIDQALNDATASFNRARSNLPDTIETARLFKFDPSQLPVYEFALTSPSLQSLDLRVFAEEELARELGVVPGVAGVDVSGGVKEEVRVNLDLARLQALGVGLTDVLDELRNRNQDVSGGRLLGSNSEPLIRTVGRFQSADEIKNLSFEVNSDSDTTVLNRRVYLRDFAEVIDGSEQQRIYVLLNGEPAVKVSIQKQPDANTVNVVDGVKKRLAELQASGVIPEGTILTSTLDESQFIRNSISNVVTSGLIGTGLAAFAVLLFLGSLRQTFIIVIAIPLASLAAIILMGIFGLSLNVFSLGGLALGVGIVVDNSIVMLENIAEGAGMTPGKDSKTRLNSQQLIEQAERSSQEIESALIASTSTNLVAVMPFLLIGGFISLLFNELILTITFSVAASIVIAVTIVPMLTSRTLAWKFSSGLSKFWLLQEFNRRFDAATNRYSRFLADILRWRFLTVAIAIILFGGGSLWMAPQIPQEILPRISTGQARLNAQFPPGTPLETNRKVMAMVDDILLKQPETEYVFSTAGGALFATNVSANPLRGTSTITLKPGTNTEAYIERVTQEFNKLNLVGIRLRLSPGQVRGLILSNSPARGADVDIILQGNDTDNLEQAGRDVLTALEERSKLVRFRPDADDRQPELQIRPDWDRVANFGLTTSDIGDTIQTAIQGSVPTRLQRSNRLVDVRVQLNEASIQEVSQLQRLPLFVNNNRQVRLSDVATITQGQAPGEIQRINQRQVVIFAGNLTQGANLSDAFTEVDTILSSIKLPEGVSVLPSSAAASNQELQNSLQLLGGLASFLVFVVMAVQYNSLIDPLVIMLTIPLALAGGIFGLYITNTAIGATVIVGAVLLVGIVVNNAIIMVELANQIRKRDKVDRKTAILQAAPQRLRPVLMTTITTVLGMFPLALGIGEGSEFLQPLGVVVFSGLSLATLLTLFIIPCFYTMLHDLLHWRWAKPILIHLGGWKKKFY
ncbi:efflux RND transporter permease subunit [Nodularia spumigena CS-584]|jgi:CzcA family heavy metal efflux pump|uniref:Efflux RND transporter permease subunit n=1 Tax=Nodularia spumigena UHCC 0060 TaxID=3110300 RepID=A0ABU5UP80_NODSP|nr:efflux RND transporter permease subunit [Nodularia spumigena]AHJ27287.1 Cobalt-zinc-cadmium resistance protein CzcA; Cation efflux system protein CusA [Nodularia spumigena CCY9414]EAW42793.1 Acriflavin resistance protein [Nodularia spumigena CCY9414]MDB9385088.1 efflux RND transporter permease subunit [Nodularia spumigena CS-584]MEA5526175.1 efflux RND transporter permease subunit [Nodularia spumigena UHCC 0143]MEA5608091.1 efflux RND transporter permease subunit [Nodularia spumigena UHCC 0